MPSTREATAENITTLRINRLVGRMLRVPSKHSRREILLIYDLHMDLESVHSFAKKLSRYGTVTVPDLPGFGGMTSFYKTKKQPTIENYCAYLAAFIKLRYKTRRLTIVGLGVGGTFAVKTLQHYPDVYAKVNNVLLLGSLVEKSDRKLGRFRRSVSLLGYRVLLLRAISALGGTIIMRGPLLRVALGLANLQAAPLNGSEIAEQNRLWRGDDLRSHLLIQRELLNQSMAPKRLDIPVFALAVNTPKDFDYTVWSEHIKILFTRASVMHSRRKVEVPAHSLFETLPTEAKKFLRQ